MGYETYFSGEFSISPPLTDEQVDEADYIVAEHELGWTVNNTTVQAEDGKHYDYISGLLTLIEEFFLPKGFLLAGEVYWDGEESDDRGVLEINSPLLAVIEKTGEINYRVNHIYKPTLREVPDGSDPTQGNP